jgi:hypothetical protein
MLLEVRLKSDPYRGFDGTEGEVPADALEVVQTHAISGEIT